MLNNKRLIYSTFKDCLIVKNRNTVFIISQLNIHTYIISILVIMYILLFLFFMLKLLLYLYYQPILLYSITDLEILIICI